MHRLGFLLLLGAACSFDLGAVPRPGSSHRPSLEDRKASDLGGPGAEPRRDSARHDGARRDSAKADGPKRDQPPREGPALPVDGPPCLPPLTRCGTLCTDTQTDDQNCGGCGKPCTGGSHCQKGLCCPPGTTNCSNVCVDTAVDPKNCGVCGKACTASELCKSSTCTTASACASGSDDQVFGGGMRGCKGSVSFQDRAKLCAAGSHVCTAQEWIGKRGSATPTHIYWTDNFLYADSGAGGCAVRTTVWVWCDEPGSPPMRVCNGKSDTEGNTCNWTNCGFETKTPNQYFGGCQGNPTAGTLCCL